MDLPTAYNRIAQLEQELLDKQAALESLAAERDNLLADLQIADSRRVSSALNMNGAETPIGLCATVNQLADELEIPHLKALMRKPGRPEPVAVIAGVNVYVRDQVVTFVRAAERPGKRRLMPVE